MTTEQRLGLTTRALIAARDYLNSQATPIDATPKGRQYVTRRLVLTGGALGALSYYLYSKIPVPAVNPEQPTLAVFPLEYGVGFQTKGLFLQNEVPGIKIDYQTGAVDQLMADDRVGIGLPDNAIRAIVVVPDGTNHIKDTFNLESHIRRVSREQIKSDFIDFQAIVNSVVRNDPNPVSTNEISRRLSLEWARKLKVLSMQINPNLGRSPNLTQEAELMIQQALPLRVNQLDATIINKARALTGVVKPAEARLGPAISRPDSEPPKLLTAYQSVTFAGGVIYNDLPGLYVNISTRNLDDIYNNVSNMKPADGRKFVIVFSSQATPQNEVLIEAVVARPLLARTYTIQSPFTLIVVPLFDIMNRQLAKFPTNQLLAIYGDMEQEATAIIIDGMNQATTNSKNLPRLGLTGEEIDYISARGPIQIVDFRPVG